MGTDPLSERIKSVVASEDGDAAYRRLYGDQVKACDFRRWFSHVRRDGTTREITGDLLDRIREYVAEGLHVEEAFRTECPDYVGPGEFAIAYDHHMKHIMSQQSVVPFCTDHTPATVATFAPLGEIAIQTTDLPPTVVPVEDLSTREEYAVTDEQEARRDDPEANMDEQEATTDDQDPPAGHESETEEDE